MNHFPVNRCMILIASVAALSCNEDLPTRTTPTDILEAVLINIESDSIVYIGSESSTSVRFEHAVAYFQVKNIYEETLESEADVNGKLELWLDALPGFKSTAAVAKDDLIPSSNYNETTGLLTLDPQAKISLKVTMNLMLDNGFAIYNYVNVEEYRVSIRPNYYYYKHEPSDIHYRLSVTPFKGMAPVVTEGYFKVRFVGRIYYRP